MGYSRWEFVLYAILRSAPIIFFGYLILRYRSRFSQKISAILFSCMGVSWVSVSFLGTRIMENVKIGAIVEIIQSVVLIALLLLAIKDQIGKLLFVFFMLYTVGGLTSFVGKHIEIVWNPVKAYKGYCWTASVTIVFAIIVVFIPFALAIHRDVVAIMGMEGESTAWRYCWLIPAAFYMFWMQNLYRTGSSLDCASKLSNVLYLIAIFASSFLIYHMVIRMIIEHNLLLKTRAENQALTVQVMEYDDLSKRIKDARKTRHDLRHHVALLEQFADNMDVAALREYIDSFRKVHRLEEPMTYCENMTANAVLTYFAQMAAEQEIEFRSEFVLPEKVAIEHSDLAVLLGNLLENAVEACTRQSAEQPSVRIHGGFQGDGVIAFTVDNTNTDQPRQNRSGEYMSSKHDGKGIGTESVREIVGRYGGVVNFESEPGMFCVSVLMYVKQSTENA
jgi:signal transduction histidine kinase